MLTNKIVSIFGCLLLCNAVYATSESCTVTKNVCVQKGGTRYFDGVPVTLPCWQYKSTQQCGAKSDNNCQPLRNEGCVQVDAKCRIMLGDVCVVQDKTYRCPIEKCTDADGIICGGSFYCMNGNCSAHVPVQSKDFNQAVTGMAAVGSAGADIKKTNGIQAFTGQGAKCSIDVLGFKDCCKDSGWGKDIGLVSCTKAEKALGKAKEKGLVVETANGHNKYCSNKVLEVCVEWKKSYCTFNSLLAKIVQKQGRHDQLGIDFGSAKDPNCRGVSPAELSRLNFGRMDFSALYKQIQDNTKFPGKGSTEQEIAKRIKDFYEHNKKHD